MTNEQLCKISKYLTILDQFFFCDAKENPDMREVREHQREELKELQEIISTALHDPTR